MHVHTSDVDVLSMCRIMCNGTHLVYGMRTHVHVRISERTPHASTLVMSDDDEEEEGDTLPINKTYADKYEDEQRKLATSKSEWHVHEITVSTAGVVIHHVRHVLISCMNDVDVHVDVVAEDGRTRRRDELAELSASLDTSAAAPVDSDDDTDEDEDGTLLTPDVDVTIHDIIHRIRTKDPSIYDANTTFFQSKHDVL